jgi:hypothetical protein
VPHSGRHKGSVFHTQRKHGSGNRIDRKLLFSRTARRVSFFAQRRDFQHGASLFKEGKVYNHEVTLDEDIAASKETLIKCHYRPFFGFFSLWECLGGD